jgi:hypothetical protein
LNRCVAVFILAGVMMTGCHHETETPKEKPTTMPTLYGTAAQGPLAAETKPTLVQSGEPPLAYRVESNVTIQVTDITTGEMTASAKVKAGDFVAVTRENGVVIGGERLVKGPLPEGRRYGIYLEQPSANVFRSGAIVPGTR